MDFRFTDEQKMTAEAVEGLLADLCQASDLRRLMESGDARDEKRWTALVEMGLQGALVAEEEGGLGLKPADFVLVAEACGRAGLPEPLVDNAGVAIPLLADIVRATGAGADLLEQALAGEITVAAAHPVNAFIADADTAGAIIAIWNDELFVVTPDAVELVRQQSSDPFRRLFTLAARPSSAVVSLPLSEAQAYLDAALDRGALFSAAQLAGIAQRAVDLGVAYSKERMQFGKPIGSYQAVKHLLATAQVKIEFVRPVIYAAAAATPDRNVFSRSRISHAKIMASEAADLACRTSVQVHGAMGYSWEVDVHFFLKRALALASWWGDARFHRARVATRVFGHPLGADQTFPKG
ncbi:acyl-CoA dehydrogenase [Nitratireductor aestuarii]|uniref:Acyl-CoA dehydrogenase n=1 Tax=Nitratireductor aestuarii TaxID=1735103 RepID=A0A916RN70_9HYPH|nr:acyl-CoA dehydrogenase family protein [Nitratireductor aestuarii]GGA63476.1 acyl-CoA dehydrogenase [Nitratireductor aestuarii]